MKLGSPKATFHTADHWPYRKLSVPQIILSISSSQVYIFPPRVGSPGACGDRHDNRPCCIKNKNGSSPNLTASQKWPRGCILHFTHCGLLDVTSSCTHVSLRVSETSKVHPVFWLFKWLWCGPYYLHCMLCPFQATQWCLHAVLFSIHSSVCHASSLHSHKFSWQSHFCCCEKI